MNLYVTNPQFNNIHAVAHLHPGVHPWSQHRRANELTFKGGENTINEC